MSSLHFLDTWHPNIIIINIMEYMFERMTK